MKIRYAPTTFPSNGPEDGVVSSDGGITIELSVLTSTSTN